MLLKSLQIYDINQYGRGRKWKEYEDKGNALKRIVTFVGEDKNK